MYKLPRIFGVVSNIILIIYFALFCGSVFVMIMGCICITGDKDYMINTCAGYLGTLAMIIVGGVVCICLIGIGIFVIIETKKSIVEPGPSKPVKVINHTGAP